MPQTTADGHQSAAEDDQLLLMPEISAMTRIPVDTLRYLRHRGEGPPMFRLRRRVVGRRSQVLRWIAEQEQASQADRSGDAA